MRVARDINVYPMIPAGATIDDMILEPPAGVPSALPDAED